MSRFIICNLYKTRLLLADELRDEQIDGECSTNWRYENAYNLVGKPEGKTPIIMHRTDWNIIQTWILTKKYWEEMDWIRLAHEKDKWHPLVKKVI